MARRGRKPNLELRGNILALLAQGSQTVAYCACEFSSNPVTTKNHITAMVNLGLVAGGESVKHINPETGEASRGRPAQLFSITEAGQAALALDDTSAALTPPEPVVEAAPEVETPAAPDAPEADAAPDETTDDSGENLFQSQGETLVSR